MSSLCHVNNNRPLLMLQVAHYSDCPGNGEVVNLLFSKLLRGNAGAFITMLYAPWSSTVLTHTVHTHTGAHVYFPLYIFSLTCVQN